MTDNKIPFIFCNVGGTNWTVDDNAHHYALVLSHEIAEMVVDPSVDHVNPEVCDGCAGNCGTIWFDCFDNNANFVGASQTIPSTFGYSFFINSIIKRDAIDPMSPDFCALTNIGPQAACSYAMRQVPHVITETVNTATQLVLDARLVPRLIDNSIADVSKDPQQTVQQTVLSVIPWVSGQSPGAEDWVPEGTVVEMTVSHKPQP